MQHRSSRLVTPEAVVLQFETAGLGSRLLAALIDVTIQGVVLTVALIAFAGLASTGQSATFGIVVVLLIATAVLLGYPIAFESLWRGRTPGKAAFGLRVVTTDGAPIRFRHAAVRGFLILVDLYLTSGAGAVLAILLTRDNQRLGDLAAGTLVLRQRTGAAPPLPMTFTVPAGYEAYAATLDPAGLGGDDHVAVRSFLVRAPTLAQETRASLVTQLATGVAARMGHTPPPGTNPEAFLACVAALHQSRAGGSVGSGAGPTSVSSPPAPEPAWEGVRGTGFQRPDPSPTSRPPASDAMPPPA